MPKPYRSKVDTSSGSNCCDYVNHCVPGSTDQLKFVNELSFNFNSKPFDKEAPPDRRLLPNCTYKNENNKLLIWTTPQWYKYQFRHTTEHSHTTGTNCILHNYYRFCWVHISYSEHGKVRQCKDRRHSRPYRSSEFWLHTSEVFAKFKWGLGNQRDIGYRVQSICSGAFLASETVFLALHFHVRGGRPKFELPNNSNTSLNSRSFTYASSKNSRIDWGASGNIPKNLEPDGNRLKSVKSEVNILERNSGENSVRY